MLPWRTAIDNVQFGLEIKRVPRQERRAIAERFINIVGLTSSRTAIPTSSRAACASASAWRGRWRSTPKCC